MSESFIQRQFQMWYSTYHVEPAYHISLEEIQSDVEYLRTTYGTFNVWEYLHLKTKLLIRRIVAERLYQTRLARRRQHLQVHPVMQTKPVEHFFTTRHLNFTPPFDWQPT